MPNWCYNKIKIEDNNNETFRAALKAVYEKKDRNQGLLNFFRPQPEYLYKEPVGQDSPKLNWYNWNTANWGTKWDADFHGLDMDDDAIYINCSTPWGPPNTAIVHLAEETGFTITMGYEEAGMDFIGLSENGYEYYEEEFSSYEWSEEFCEFMGYDLESIKDDKIDDMLEDFRNYLDFEQIRDIWQENI